MTGDYSSLKRVCDNLTFILFNFPHLDELAKVL